MGERLRYGPDGSQGTGKDAEVRCSFYKADMPEEDLVLLGHTSNYCKENGYYDTNKTVHFNFRLTSDQLQVLVTEDAEQSA